MHAVTALWHREVRKFVREKSRVVGALAQPLAFWLLLGFGFAGTFQLPAGQADVGYLDYLFPGIVALVALFTAIFSTLYVVEERQRGFLQAALVAPVSRTTIVLGNTLGGTTLAVAQCLLFWLALPIVGRPYTLSGLLLTLAGATLLAVGFTALGFVMAWRVETTRGFHALMNVLLMPLWFLSGAAFPLAGAPPVLAWMVRLNPVYYGVEVLRAGFYAPQPSPLTGPPLSMSLGVSAAFAVALMALAVWTARRPVFG